MKCEDHSCVWGVPCNGKKDCKDGSDEVGLRGDVKFDMVNTLYTCNRDKVN
jgi:hypothetical protein